ncbi:hypothetical protein [Xanthomonas phaseoli]|uniref:hypothetical protein n=1 Tax=Xanthomonas phaseoli TaxID=1985254 RepID=UPI001E51F749|nr:hypothetical protein [Xanthomonas phaseoli]MCC8468511.1 hypothetical protein [Xanthomonas phaseoli]
MDEVAAFHRVAARLVAVVAADDAFTVMHQRAGPAAQPEVSAAGGLDLPRLPLLHRLIGEVAVFWRALSGQVAFVSER